MLTQSLLIDEQTFKDLGPIVGSFEYAIIIPYIRVSTDIDIAELTGESLLRRISNGIIANDLNTDEVLLLEEYLHPTLVHLAMGRAYTNMLFKPDNSSIVKRDSENGTAADLGEVSFLQDQEKTIGQSYAKRLKAYLDANAGLYPEYRDEVLGQIKPSGTASLYGGINLGGIGCSTKNSGSINTTNPDLNVQVVVNTGISVKPSIAQCETAINQSDTNQVLLMESATKGWVVFKVDSNYFYEELTKAT